jgi:hypothetical protein
LANTTGTSNTAIGFQSLVNNETAQNNTALGAYALYSNTTGSNNTACGMNALKNNSTGTKNVALGLQALGNNATGSNLVSNVAIGYMAGGLMTTGYGNVVIGEETGKNISTGYDNVWIGKMTGNSGTLTYYNSIAIGTDVALGGSNTVRIGDNAMTSIGGQVGWTTLSDGRYKVDVSEDIKGLDFIKALRPVSYRFDLRKLDADRNKTYSDELTRSYQNENIRYTGFIAQEVEAIANEIGYDFSGIDKPADENGQYGLRYAEFVVPLVKAVQEQQAMIEQLQREIEELKARE